MADLSELQDKIKDDEKFFVVFNGREDQEGRRQAERDKQIKKHIEQELEKILEPKQYKYLTPEEAKRPNRYDPEANITTCDICGQKFKGKNATSHRRTRYHQKYADITNGIRRIILCMSDFGDNI